jgi:short-subunit dehydrogenase
VKRVLIIGATSAIARVAARRWAGEGARLFLVARSAERLQATANDLCALGAEAVATRVLDAIDYGSHGAMLHDAWNFLDKVEIVMVAYGVLPDQRKCEEHSAEARAAFEVNAVSAIAILTRVAHRMEEAGSGCIAVLTSVAGDRGRASNYVYGSAKSAVSTFLAGLRNRLHPRGVRVLDIRLGLVDTPMTAHLSKNALYVSPEMVGRRIVRVIEGSNGTVYIPGFWRWIMAVVRAIPDVLFRRFPL